MGLQALESKNKKVDEKTSDRTEDQGLILPKVACLDLNNTEYLEQVRRQLENPQIGEECKQLRESPSLKNLQKVLHSLYENSDLRYDLSGWDGNAIDCYGILTEEFSQKQTACKVTSVRVGKVIALLLEKEYLAPGVINAPIEMDNGGHTALAVCFNASEPEIIVDPWVAMKGKSLPVFASRLEWEKEVHSFNRKIILEQVEFGKSFRAKKVTDKNWVTDRNGGREGKIPGGYSGSPERKHDYLVFTHFVERHQGNPNEEAKPMLPPEAMDPVFFRETRDRMVFMLKNEGLIDETQSNKYLRIDSFEDFSTVASAYFTYFYKDSTRIKESAVPESP